MAWDLWHSNNVFPPDGAEPTQPGSPVGTLRSLNSTSSMPRDLRRMVSRVISFKDMQLYMGEDHPDTDSDASPDLRAAPGSGLLGRAPSNNYGVEKQKLVIIMVGLPARGKTFLCNKLICYLNWLGHKTAHFNVGKYRRQFRSDNEMQDASFFDHNNAAAMQVREQALNLALEELYTFLAFDDGQIAILDATNSTEERRHKLVSAFAGKFKYLFIETICNDEVVLEANYRNKMKYSPDYKGCDNEQALADFKARIRKYEEVYEPINSRSMHYIKLTDMVTGRGHIDINRISGYIPGKIVFFLMQICKAGLMGNTRKIWLTRHGESMFNTMELLGGDSELSTRGQEYARHLPDVLMARVAKASEDVAAQVITPTLGTSYPDPSAIPISVWTSTLRRTIATARGLPFPKLAWKALDEIDAGICDGLSYADIAAQHPDEFAARKKDKLRYRYPRGESYLDCVQRIEPVITELERERESVVIVAHQAILRIIYGYLMAKPQEDIPNISIPLHTLIELTPMPDGTLSELRIPVPVAGDRPLRDHSSNGNNPLPLTSSMDVTTNAALAAATVAMAAAAVRGSSGSGAGAVPVEMHTGSALGEGAIGAAPAVEATPVVSASATC